MQKPDKKTLVKFVLLLLLLVGYFGYLSWKYDVATGGLVAGLTWSFFVLCTPVADAGFLLDFPMRLLFGVKMFVSEICVWAIAISLNLYAISFARDAYAKTFLTAIFEKILVNPWPYWGIIALSGVGTFLSVKFGDEVMDAVGEAKSIKDWKHRFNHTMLVYIVLFVLIFIGYEQAIEALGIGEFLEK